MGTVTMSSCVASKGSGSIWDPRLMVVEDRFSVKDRGRLERLPRPLNLKNSGRGQEEGKELMLAAIIITIKNTCHSPY